MAGRCKELQLIRSIGQTQKNKTQRTKTRKGARIEIASFSEWITNRNLKTLCTKKGARIEIASFSEWFANRKRCAQRKGARIEDAAHKERRANRRRCAQRKAQMLCKQLRELFRMAPYTRRTKKGAGVHQKNKQTENTEMIEN